MAVDMTILVVEDDESIRELLLETLSQGGYAAEFAVDGEQAIDAIRSQPPSIVLLDLDLPKVSGFEVLQYIRSAPATASAPVIILTAHSQSDDIKRAIQLGAQDFIGKPFEGAQLLRRVARASKMAAAGGVKS
jgi:DNA-binding response OmpR family regulator